jgi:hypothetical protein
MSWNYRVIRSLDPDADVEPEYTYAIHEVYYSEDDGLSSWTQDPVAFFGDSLEDLRDMILIKLHRALTLPVLEVRDGKLVELPASE